MKIEGDEVAKLTKDAVERMDRRYKCRKARHDLKEVKSLIENMDELCHQLQYGRELLEMHCKMLLKTIDENKDSWESN